MVDEEIDHETSRKDNDCEKIMNMEIWEDLLSIMVLNGNQFPIECGEEKSKVCKPIIHYYWSNDNLMFKGLVLFRPNE